MSKIIENGMKIKELEQRLNEFSIIGNGNINKIEALESLELPTMFKMLKEKLYEEIAELTARVDQHMKNQTRYRKQITELKEDFKDHRETQITNFTTWIDKIIRYRNVLREFIDFIKNRIYLPSREYSNFNLKNTKEAIKLQKRCNHLLEKLDGEKSGGREDTIVNENLQDQHSKPSKDNYYGYPVHIPKAQREDGEKSETGIKESRDESCGSMASFPNSKPSHITWRGGHNPYEKDGEKTVGDYGNPPESPVPKEQKQTDSKPSNTLGDPLCYDPSTTLSGPKQGSTSTLAQREDAGSARQTDHWCGCCSKRVNIDDCDNVEVCGSCAHKIDSEKHLLVAKEDLEKIQEINNRKDYGSNQKQSKINWYLNKYLKEEHDEEETC